MVYWYNQDRIGGEVREEGGKWGGCSRIQILIFFPGK